MRGTGSALQYVLITPARNEEQYIRATLESMVARGGADEKTTPEDDGITGAAGENPQAH